MMSQTFECLDLTDRKALDEYERAFYTAFVRVTGNQLIRSLWVWDDAKRQLKTRIAYEDQLIFVGRNEAGKLETAIATNIACREWQSAAFGFSRPTEQEICCEFLTLFSVGDYRLGLKLRFWEACFAELRRRGLNTAYATTAARLLQGYLRIGGVLLEEKEITGEMRYFLKFSLERDWMIRRGGG
ncbi:MAG: hypothetical protein ACFCU9_10680 [Cyanophyceae cyanobacterium]